MCYLTSKLQWDMIVIKRYIQNKYQICLSHVSVLSIKEFIKIPGSSTCTSSTLGCIWDSFSAIPAAAWGTSSRSNRECVLLVIVINILIQSFQIYFLYWKFRKLISSYITRAIFLKVKH